jgi:hypothetical protein
MHMAQVETWIRERAYAIWQQEGCPDGREAQHWEQAAREILSRAAGVTAGEAGKSSAKSAPAQKPKATRARKAA